MRARSIRIFGCAAVLAMSGCVDIPAVPDVVGTESSGAGPGSSTSGTPSPSSTSGTTDAGTTGSTTDETDADATTGTTGRSDVGEPGGACDIFAQDCPAGQKCMPYAEDGGTQWSAWRCVPVADDPAQVGEPCQAERSPTSGLDDCALGAMCWYLDPETLEGTCVSLCMGSDTEEGGLDVYCEDPETLCLVSSQPIYLCLPVCDPVAQDCPAGEACHPQYDRWECLPDASGDAGAYGDPCEFVNGCDPGLVCLDPAAVPPGLPCEGSAGCCSEVCDLDDPAGDAQCTGAAAGQVCVPWFEEGAELPLWDDLGVCVVPQ